MLVFSSFIILISGLIALSSISHVLMAALYKWCWLGILYLIFLSTICLVSLIYSRQLSACKIESKLLNSSSIGYSLLLNSSSIGSFLMSIYLCLIYSFLSRSYSSTFLNISFTEGMSAISSKLFLSVHSYCVSFIYDSSLWFLIGSFMLNNCFTDFVVYYLVTFNKYNYI